MEMLEMEFDTGMPYPPELLKDQELLKNMQFVRLMDLYFSIGYIYEHAQIISTPLLKQIKNNI